MRTAFHALLGSLLLTAAAGCEDPVPAPPGPDRLSPEARGARPDIARSLREERDRRPHPADRGGRGWLEAGSPRRVEASSAQRFAFGFEAGPHGVAPGGAVFLQVSPFWDWSTPQVQDPGAPGYTRVSSPAEGVELEPETLDRGLLAVHVRGRALAPGERIRIEYGAGPAGARVDRFAERESPFWFGVDGDGDGIREFLDEPVLVEVAAGPPRELRAFLPATARPGERVRLTAAVLDGAGNAGTDFVGELRLLGVPDSVEGPRVLAFGPEDRGVRALELTVTRPGLLRFAVEGPDGLRAETNPLRVASDGPRVLFADLHGHSVLSDGTGTPEDWFRYARDVSNLDAAALTDHDRWGLPFLDESPEGWQRIRAAVSAFDAPGRFTTLLGYEWTHWEHGHRHVLYFADEGEVYSSVDPESDEPAELWARLRGRPALTFAHHSAGGPVATDWSVPPDPVLEPLTEIVSVHGSSEALDSPAPIHRPVVGNFVRDVLGLGYRLGFVGSGDSHDGHPGLAHFAAASGGLAAVLAEENTRAALLEALRARRCYATNGPRILLRASLDGRVMGSAVPPGRARLLVGADAPGPIERVDLVRSGEIAARVPVGGEPGVELELPLEALAPGEWLYVRVVQSDGGAAWSSPFFVDARVAAAPRR